MCPPAEARLWVVLASGSGVVGSKHCACTGEECAQHKVSTGCLTACTKAGRGSAVLVLGRSMSLL